MYSRPSLFKNDTISYTSNINREPDYHKGICSGEGVLMPMAREKEKMERLWLQVLLELLAAVLSNIKLFA